MQDQASEHGRIELVGQRHRVNSDVFKGANPASCADLERGKFRGANASRWRIPELEFALLADGVPG
jgi:hypothetical protein